MELRNWQKTARNAVQHAWTHGTRNPTVVAPTGAGKTALAAAIINDYPGKVLFTAHRDQLIDQTAKGFRNLVYDRTVGIIRSSDNEIDADVIVASLQTLATPHRLQAYMDANPPDLVIADEAHMSGAPQFARIFRELGVPSQRVVSLGLSATLGRTSGTPLHELWSDPVFTMSLKEAIVEGICVQPVGIRVHIPNGSKSLLDMARDAAEWSPTLGNALEASDAPSIIAEAIQEHCDGRAVIGFAPNVRAALVLSNACKHIGITSDVITANTPSSVREEMFRASQDGELKVLWSVDTISVGADLPWVSAVVLSRDSGSRTWFVQAVGRGLRTYEGKTDCLVLDCSSTSKRLELDTYFDLGRDSEGVGGGEQGSSSSTTPDLEDLASVPPVEVGRVEYSGFDFFSRSSAWSTTLGGTRFIGSYGQLVFVVPNGDGTFSVGSVSNSVWKQDRAKRHAADLDLNSAVLLAEVVAEQLDRAAPVRYGKQMQVSSASASWRSQSKPMTEGQRTMLSNLREALVLRSAEHLGVDVSNLNRAMAASVIDVATASAVIARLGLDPEL